MVKTNLAMLMNIETVESKHVITLGELGRREREMTSNVVKNFEPLGRCRFEER